jgi:hypothetical protein
MYVEIILMCVAVAIAAVVILSSKFLRTLCREAIFHRRQRCEIQVHGNDVSVKQLSSEQKEG